MFAIINGHYDVATLLVDKGANVNLADRTGATPLYSAVDMHTMPTSFGRPDLTPPVVAGSVERRRRCCSRTARTRTRGSKRRS